MKILNKKTKTNRNPHTANHEPPDSFNLPEVSARRYQDLFNNASDAIFIRDLEGNIIEVNEAAVILTGYAHNELTGINVSEFLTAESFKATMKKQKALLEEKTATQRYELEIIRKDGVRLTAESRTSLLTHNGRPIGVQGIVRDITERKRAEEALRFLSSVVEQAKDSVIVTNRNHKIEYVNKATEELFGYSREELIGLTPLILNAEPTAEDIQRNIYKTVSSGKVMTGTILNKRKDGSTFVCDFKVSLLSDKGGRVLGYIGIQRDITEQRRMEEALQESKEKYKALFENLNDAAFLADVKTGCILNANKQSELLLGRTREEIIGIHQTKLHPPEMANEYRQRFFAHTQKGRAVDYNGEVIRKDGSIVSVNISASPINIGDKELILGLFRDITEHKQAEEALRESQQNFRNSFDSFPLGIRIVTAEGELIYANRAVLDIYGYSSIEELKSVPTKQRYTPKSYAEHQMRKAKRKQGELVPADYEISIVRKDGEVRHLAVFRKEVIWGGEMRFQVLYQDITERKRAEMALRQSEEFNSSLLTNSPGPILVLNADGSIRYANPALEKLTGFSSAELVGSKPPYPWWIEKTPGELSRRLVQAMHLGTRKYESLYRKKNGERFWVEKIFKIVKMKGEFKYYLVNWVDLTEQRRLKANMEFYLSQVTRAQEEERKRIAREIHDESIQSLATLALGIDAIAREKKRLPEDVILRLKGLRAETDSISDGLRRFSHELRPGVIDQVGLVPALEILTEELNKENRVKTSLEVAGSEQRLIPETELALFRIAQEALRNVKKHSSATKAAIRLKFTRSRVKLTVSDDGRGFELPGMLSDFAADGKLGLIGMQERIRLLGGKLLVRSWVGRGTTVVVEMADVQGMKG